MNLFIESPTQREVRRACARAVPDEARRRLYAVPRAEDTASLRIEESASGGTSRDSGRPDGSYSVAQESYQEELAYLHRRTRRSRAFAVLRVVSLIVLVPLALVALFLLAYVLTCIMDGASPEEVVELVSALLTRLADFVQSLIQKI